MTGCASHDDHWGLVSWVCECGCRHRFEVSVCHCGHARNADDQPWDDSDVIALARPIGVLSPDKETEQSSALSS